MKKSSIIIAISILILTILWIFSGQYFDKDKDSILENNNNNIEKEILTKVRVQDSIAKEISKIVSVQGQTEANKKISISSETSGRILEINNIKGEEILKGDLLFLISQKELKIKINENKAKLLSAKSQIEEQKSKLTEYEIKLNSEKNLFEKGLSSKSKLASAKSNFDSAKSNLDTAKSNLTLVKSELDTINNELEKTMINAPFDGIMTSEHMEVGEFVQPGTSLGTYVELNPILVVCYISEKELRNIEVGKSATISTSLNERAVGKISYISPIAEKNTRTFRIEITIINNDLKIKDGLTASIEIESDKVKAHKISPSILSLKDNGEIGVKIVDEKNIVKFYPINIVSDTNSGMWISGIPDNSKIIVVGQEYAPIGETVSIEIIN